MNMMYSVGQKNRSNAGAIARIVIWLAVLCLLGGLFVACLVNQAANGGSGTWTFPAFTLGIFSAYWYDDSAYSVGDFSLTERITSLDIDWVAGDVTIVSGEGDTLTVQEQLPEGDTDASNQLRWRVRNGKLIIKFVGPTKQLRTSEMQKSLVVTVPAGWMQDLNAVNVDTASATVRMQGLEVNRVDVDTASGEVQLMELTARHLNVDTASGGVSLSDLTATDLNVDTASGQVRTVHVTADTADVDTASGSITFEGTVRNLKVDTASGRSQVTLAKGTVAGKVSVSSASGAISLTGAADEVDLDTASGAMVLTLTQAAKEVSVDSVSGGLEVHLPADIAGFTVGMDSVSGGIMVNGFATEGGNRRRVYGDGSMTIDCDTVSGNVVIFNDA
jgi:DUF4097 and DUF4098 domain-containing protein YvlB